MINIFNKIKIPLFIIYTFFQNLMLTAHIKIDVPDSLFLTYSGLIALLRIFTIYLLFMLLCLLPTLMNINSETIIRIHKKRLYHQLIKKRFIYSLSTLLIIYINQSIFYIYHQGLSQYLHYHLPFFISLYMIIYLLMFLCLLFIFLAIYFYSNHLALSILITDGLGLLIAYNNIYYSRYITIFEDVFIGHHFNLFNPLIMIIFLLLLIYIFYHICFMILNKKDFVYEQEI